MQSAVELYQSLANTVGQMAQKTDPKPYLCARCSDTGQEIVSYGNKSGVKPCGADPCVYTAMKYQFGIGVPKIEQATKLGTLQRVPLKTKGTETDPPHKGNETALQHAKFFLDGTHHGLYMHGLPGVGKTSIACAVLNGCMAKRQTGRFVRVPELLRSWINDEDDEFQRLVRTPVLCLDDVGAQQGTDYARRTLGTLFDAREAAGNRTIWTSNLDLNALAIFLEDDRLTSRIQGTCKIVEVGGPDHRLKGPKPRAAAPEKFTGQR